MAFRWVFAESEQDVSVRALQESLNIPSTIAKLLSLREIETFDAARNFFRPGLELLHDPFRMKDMEKAADRLSKAIRLGEKVLIYGDYDVDGTTATSCMLLFLREFGVEAEFFIPHRFKDGYGINSDGIHRASEIGADLVISVDCGITAVKEAKLARELGIDLVICDHHTVGEKLPDAVAVLDPKRPDCDYPFDGLSGAGVAFKLIQATIERLGLAPDMATRYLDLVAISTASDIVPVVDENRVLMRRGLEQLNQNPRPGLKALLEVVKQGGATITGTTIVFTIGPRINAAGRMGDAGLAVELLISEEPAEAKSLAGKLETINRRRRSTDTRTMKEAVTKLEQEYDLEALSSMVLHDPDWHLGVIGIVASRLVDAYYRPAIMLSSVDGKIKGSARSIRGFNIYDALKNCEDLLEQFGGHEYAAGLTMDQSNLDEFRKRIDQIACRDLSENDFEPELTIDHQMDLSHVDQKFWKLLSQFEPFGPGNQRPVFVSRNVELASLPTIVGKGHLKMRVRQNGSASFDAIGFNMHEYLPLVRDAGDRRIDLAYVIEENYWNRKRTLQLQLKDIHLESELVH